MFGWLRIDAKLIGWKTVVSLAVLSLLTAAAASYAHDPRMMEMIGLGGETDEADLAMYRGHALVRNGQFKQAINEYTTAILLKPHLTLAFVSRAMTYADIGEYRAALADLDVAMTHDSVQYEVYINRGMVYSHLELYDSALVNINRAIKLDSLQPEAYTNRSIYYSQLGRLGDALRDCSRALELDSTFSPAWLSLTILHVERGDKESATQSFKKLLEYQTPEQATIIERLKYFVDTTAIKQP